MMRSTTTSMYGRRAWRGLRLGLGIVLLLGAAPALAVGCGGSAQPVVPQGPRQWGPAPPLAVKLQVSSPSNEGKALVGGVTAALTAAFADAGYTLVEDAQKAAVLAKVTVNATEQKKFMQTFVNGQRQVTYDVTVDAAWTSVSDSTMVDRTTASFESDNGEMDAADRYALEDLLVQANNHGKLVKYAADQEKAKAEAEEQLWAAANADDCAKATSATACDGVKAYLEQYADGKHAAEGRRAIEAGQGAAEAKKEEETWAKAVVDQCMAPTASYDCQGVEAYLKAYPTGAHAEEARAAVKASGPKLAQLAKREEAQEKRANQVECVKECKRRFIRYTPGAYEILVQRCVSNECS